jgi:iron complex outermembrane receptor protein
VLDASTGLIALRLNNVGKLQTKGVELELTAKPNRDWMLESSLGFTDAIIKSFPTATCYLGQTAAQGCFAYGNGTAQNLAGKQLANAPRFKGNAGATYNFPLAHLNGAINLNYQYQSKVNFDLYQNPLTVQQGYGVLNGSVSLRDDLQGWKLTVFGNNLLDRHYASFIQDGAGVFGGSHVLGATLSRNSRRYVGVRLKYEF